ncbi:hypothetical protein JG688_00004401 [Phytophthora aleatoria]|uniref:Transposase n=1 Tax=Phytophthora aleatoria TaxID=2496075 RepID=A0A8J5MI16_9STRA|nr:hypothetical protein JG688_00004401 [Phytophthora aleatoria]
MGYSSDIRWRHIVLQYVYNIEISVAADVLGVSVRSLHLFKTTGYVDNKPKAERSSKWPPEVQQFVQEYVKQHPCFYFQELRESLKEKFSTRYCCSDSHICRVLRFDLGLSGKILTKRAWGSIPKKHQEYVNRLLSFYNGPE